jgi:squalene-hopene/tetraprenyl-beta-curcumene cyclase
MNSMELVRFPTTRARPIGIPAKKSPPPFCSELIGPVRNAIVRSRRLLITRQQSDGAWIGRQSGDASLLSQLIFLLTDLEREDSELAQQCAATILSEQRPDGSWSAKPDGSADISTSVQAYFALKLTGRDPTDQQMKRARSRIRKLGGADAADDMTRFVLALLGQVSYDVCDPMPPERFLFLGRCSRLRVPLSIVWSLRPVLDVGIERGVRELFLNRPCHWPPTSAKQDEAFPQRLNAVFRLISRFSEHRGWLPFRRCALNATESQLLEQFGSTRISELSLQELMWHIVALRAIGYPADSPEMCACEEQLAELVDADDETQLVYPKHRSATLGDTALVLRALIESGLSPDHPSIEEAIDAVFRAQATTNSPSTADLCNLLEGLRRLETAAPNNDYALPPDIDVRWDSNYAAGEPERTTQDWRKTIERAAAKCIDQLRGCQNPDGGWGTLAGWRHPVQASDPSVTGAALEALAGCVNPNMPSIFRRATEYLRSQQRADGSWCNADGMQKLLCTAAAIRGLLAAGVACHEDCIAAAVNWLIVEQQPTGGWDASPSQTAWAILALVAAGKVDHSAVRRGIDHLLDSQDDDGGWVERQCVLQDPDSNRWFCNDLHGVAWPLLALSTWVVAASSAEPAESDEVSLRLVAAAAEF